MSANELYHYQSRQRRQLHACKWGIAVLTAAILLILSVTAGLANLAKEQGKLITIQEETISKMDERVEVLKQTIEIMELENAIQPEV